MFLQIWPRRSSEDANVKGQLIFVRLGEMLLLRTEVVHGGGFSSSDGFSNPRGHIYVYIDANGYSGTQQNLYKDRNGEELNISHVNSDLVDDPELFHFDT